MSNFQVYKKTLSFSFVAFLVDLLALFVVAGMATAGFFIMNKSTDKALIGLAVGLVIGVILTVLIEVFLSNRVKAAQISMMVLGVTDGKLPDNTFKAGFESLHGRFGRITAFYFITRAIKGIFRQIGRGFEKVGRAVGGDVGEGVTSAINTAIQILIGYMCDCCMGWILYRKEVNGFKAGCEGAVIFFKHGKTLMRNVGRIFGMGFLSFALFGGAFFGLFYFIFTKTPGMFNSLASEIAELSTRYDASVPAFFTDPKNLMLIIAGVGGLIMFFIIHAVFVRPFILIGVLRNFMAAGIKDMPKESDFDELAQKSPKFRRLQERI